MLNRATLPGTTARTAGMRAPRPPDPMQQYVTAAMKDGERKAHNIANAQALAAVPVTGSEATLLGRLGQIITVPRAETDRLLNIREPAALPAAYVPDQAHENSISVLKSPQATSHWLQRSCVPNMRQQVYQQRYNGSPVGLPRHPNKHGTDDREIISTCCRSVSQTLQRPHTPPAGSTGATCVVKQYQMDPFLQRQPERHGRTKPARRTHPV